MNNILNEKTFKIFRDYDIRGLFPEELNDDISFKIGQGFANSVGNGSTIAIGRDVRISSKAIKEAFCEGVTSQGINVIDLGKVPSPVVYFNTRNLGLASGAMITASHLPPNWNGIKFCDARGIVVSNGTGLEKIKDSVLSSKINTSKNGKIHFYEGAIRDYAKYVMERINIRKKLSIVIDYGNSVTANVLPLILSKLNLQYKQINIDQGKFRRSSELTAYSMEGLRRAVIDTCSDLGIAYDADGDRVGFVDNLGNVYPTGEKIISIFARNALAKSKGEIILDVTCSSSTSEFIRNQGGSPVIIRVGHSYCANETLKRKALFGAQYSGHYSFPEMGCTDDAIYASLKLTEILSHSERSLSQLTDSLPASFPSRLIEVECADSTKFQTVLTVMNMAKNMGYRVDEIDGVKIYSKSGDNEWVLIRASNTSPIIRVNADGNSIKSSENLLFFGIDLVKKVMNNY